MDDARSQKCPEGVLENKHLKLQMRRGCGKSDKLRRYGDDDGVVPSLAGAYGSVLIGIISRFGG